MALTACVRLCCLVEGAGPVAALAAAESVCSFRTCKPEMATRESGAVQSGQ